eukprot:10759457-Alexandrium_andersonii.AAC.1
MRLSTDAHRYYERSCLVSSGARGAVLHGVVERAEELVDDVPRQLVDGGLLLGGRASPSLGLC